MPILIPVLLIGIIVLFSAGSGAIPNVGNLFQDVFSLNLNLRLETKDRGGSSPVIQQQQGTEIPAPFLLDTRIVAAPSATFPVQDTDQVVFEFEAITDQENVSFETQLVGVDSSWKTTSQNERTITLPGGSETYTFLVRAKAQGYADTSPASHTFSAALSPWRGKVSIASARQNPLQLQLSTNLSAGEEVKLTGWTLQGQQDSYTVPRGIAYVPAAISGGAKQDIVLKRGDRVHVSGELNPVVGNTPFRPNKCFGFLRQTRTFSISVPNSCPVDKPTTLQEVSFFTPTCQDYLLDLPSCSFPDYAQNVTILRDPECVTELKRLEPLFTYGQCVAHYRNDPDFLSPAWHIYTDGENFLRPVHDRIILRDGENRFVDEFFY